MVIVEQNLLRIRHHNCYPYLIRLNVADYRKYCTDYRIEHNYHGIMSKRVDEPINTLYSNSSITRTLPVHVKVKHWRTFLILHQYFDPRYNSIATIHLALSLLVWSIHSIALQITQDNPIVINHTDHLPITVVDFNLTGEQCHEYFWRLRIDLAW